MGHVEFRNLRKSYGSLEVVHGIDLKIENGEFVVLVGPSGCGKSTCLRMLAGLEDITSGEILIDGAVINDIEPRNRDIAMVFQDYALYPHLSVFQNIAFSLKYRGVSHQEMHAGVTSAAETLGLSQFLERYPRELSGGQRQRVAMGRAIVRRPRVFLFDEPLSNLDARLRVDMRLEMKRLHQKLKVTTIYVTHDQVEAMTLADRVVIMQNGSIEQVASPAEVYRRPATVFVAEFIGSPSMNLLNSEVDADGNVTVSEGLFRLPGALPPGPPRYLRFGIRSHDVVVVDDPDAGHVAAEVEVTEELGPDTFVFTKASGHSLVARTDPGTVLVNGVQVGLRFNVANAHFFDAGSGRRVDTGSAI